MLAAGDRAVLALAARQHGLVTAEQLAAAGFGPGAVARLVRKTWLRRVHRGVYLAGPLGSARTPEMAALLACGDRAVLSHRTAARLWRLPCPAPGAVEVTVQGSARAHAGIRVPRGVLKLVSRGEVTALLERSAGRTGAPALRAVLARDEAPSMTRSAAEARLLALLRSARLRRPKTNARWVGTRWTSS
jgi:hypothetical protein